MLTPSSYARPRASYASFARVRVRALPLDGFLHVQVAGEPPPAGHHREQWRVLPAPVHRDDHRRRHAHVRPHALVNRVVQPLPQPRLDRVEVCGREPRIELHLHQHVPDDLRRFIRGRSHPLRLVK